MYAQDQDRFFEDYAKAHVKMSELGQEANLLSEFDQKHIKHGGYVEPGLEEQERGVNVTPQ